MKFLIPILCCTSALFAQQNLVKIEGFVQGTTYHISYFDAQNRDFQPKIDTLLHKFDLVQKFCFVFFLVNCYKYKTV